MFKFLFHFFGLCFKLLLIYGVIFAVVMIVNIKKMGWIHNSAALEFTHNFLKHMFYYWSLK